MINKNLIDVIPVELLNEIDKIEAEYKKSIKKKKIVLFTILGIGASLSIASLLYNPDLTFFALFGTFFAAIFSSSLGNSKVEIDFKYQVINALFPEYFNDYKGSYEPRGFLPESDLRASGAINTYTDIDEYYGEDLMTFDTDSYNLKMSEINAIDVQTYTEKGQRKTRRVTVASGILGKLTQKYSNRNNTFFDLNLRYNSLKKQGFNIIMAGIVLGIVFILFIDSFFNSFSFLNIINILIQNFSLIFVYIIFISGFIILTKFSILKRKKNTVISENTDFNKKWSIVSTHADNPEVSAITNNKDFQSLLDKLSIYMDNYSAVNISLYFYKDCIYFYIPSINLFVPKITKTTPTILNSIESDIGVLNTLLEVCSFITTKKE